MVSRLSCKNAGQKILLFGLCLTISSCTSLYLGRYVIWNFADIEDYQGFPSRHISNAPPAFYFEKSAEAEAGFSLQFEEIEDYFENEKKRSALDDFLRSTGTTAFIVIQNDTVLYEEYFNDYTRDSINTSFSMSKSVTSALVGIAHDEGLIKSIDEPITNYIPELKAEGFEKITIKHLLTMSSGLRHTWGNAPWHDSVRSYFSTDLRKLILESKIVEEAGKRFYYSNGNTQLLGLILERVTGKSASKYLEEKIWKNLGMEYSASWSMDSERSGFELMAAGLNARAIDFAKLGRLFLNEGRWNGKRLVSEKWVAESTAIDSAPTTASDAKQRYYTVAEEDILYQFFNLDGGHYSYSWYGYSTEAGDYDFFAFGILGQFIYVSPRKKLIIVRCGKEWGLVDWWPAIFRDMADKIHHP